MERSTPAIDLWLDANEGPPPPAGLVEDLAAAGAEILRRYPDVRPLEGALATRLGLDPARILVTAGADDALERVCRAFLSGGSEIVLPVPTFEMLEKNARGSGALVREVPWPEGPYPLEQVLANVNERTALVAVVSPNNPTGAVATAADLRRLAAGARGVKLVVDLAYAEYADEDLTAEALALPGAIAVRTFSKAWGLAGLRVGYAIGRPDDVARLRACGAPYAVSGPSLALALARLERGEGDVARGVERVRSERTRLASLLAELGARPLSSQANFVLARAADARRARWLCDALAGLGILVRTFPGRAGLEDAVRIACPGDERSFQRLADALRAGLAPRALVLDLDGVLADVSHSYREAIRLTARAFGAEVSRQDVAEVKALGGASDDWEVTLGLIRRRGIEASLASVRERFEALYQGENGAAGLRERERLLIEPRRLRAWSARLAVGVVTARPRADAERFLAAQGIEGLVSALVCREDAPAKPDPAPVRLALQRLGASAAWMVGDTPDDVRAARAAGVVPIGVLPPGEENEVLGPALRAAGAARVLRGLAELEEVLP